MHTVSNIVWRLMEKIGVQAAELIVTIIVARIVGPGAYGTLAIIMSIIMILNVFVDSGFSQSVIRDKNADNHDISTVFYANLIISS